MDVGICLQPLRSLHQASGRLFDLVGFGGNAGEDDSRVLCAVTMRGSPAHALGGAAIAQLDRLNTTSVVRGGGVVAAVAVHLLFSMLGQRPGWRE